MWRRGHRSSPLGYTRAVTLESLKGLSSFRSQICFRRMASSRKFESRLPSRSKSGLVQVGLLGRGVTGGKIENSELSSRLGLFTPILFPCCCRVCLRPAVPCRAPKRSAPSLPASGPGLRRRAARGFASSGSRSTPPPRPRGPRGRPATTCTGGW